MDTPISLNNYENNSYLKVNSPFHRNRIHMTPSLSHMINSINYLSSLENQHPHHLLNHIVHLKLSTESVEIYQLLSTIIKIPISYGFSPHHWK